MIRSVLALSILSLGLVSGISLRATRLESQLLNLLRAPTVDVDMLRSTVRELEQDRGIPRPTQSQELDGVWRLLYTGNEVVQNASPIQRTVTSLRQVKIYQVVHLSDRNSSFLRDTAGNSLPDVSNVVCFGDFRLRVTALGSTVRFSPPSPYTLTLLPVYDTPGHSARRRWKDSRAEYFRSIQLEPPSG